MEGKKSINEPKEEGRMLNKSGGKDKDHLTNKPDDIETVLQVLKSAGLDPKPIEGTPGFTVDFKDDGPGVSGAALVLTEQTRFVFYLEFYQRAPKETRSLVAEFITRVNFGLCIGNFEMDYNSGGVRFKTSFDYRGDKLRDVFVRSAVIAAMDIVEIYKGALIEVMKGIKLPKQAFEEVDATIEE